VFTVLNYEQYQGFERFEKDNREHCENTARTLKERSENNNKNDKNVKKDKKVLKDIYVDSQFKPPTVEEVKIYCLERSNSVDANKWHDFYSSKGWMVGRNKMKDWEAAVRTWEHKDNQGGQANPKPNRPKSFDSIDQWYDMTKGMIE
jgi:hypothetical protein